MNELTSGYQDVHQSDNWYCKRNRLQENVLCHQGQTKVIWRKVGLHDNAGHRRTVKCAVTFGGKSPIQMPIAYDRMFLVTDSQNCDDCSRATPTLNALYKRKVF